MSRPATHITDGIHVGQIEAVAESPTDYGAILSVCQDTRYENVPDGVRYWHTSMADDLESQRNWGGSCDYSSFAEAVEKLASLHKHHDSVLVHCHKGRNRSVAVTAAYIATQMPSLSSRGAIQLIQDKRPIADPNSLMRYWANRYVTRNGR